MKVVHCVFISPNRCGLYGTARDLVKAERLVGIDAQILNTKIDLKTQQTSFDIVEDGDIKSISLEEAKKADILVHHTFIPKVLKELHIPIIQALHGRPESSMKISYGENKLHRAYFDHINNPDYMAFIYFWPEFNFAHSLDYPKEKLFLVDAPVDLDRFNPEGNKFDWGNQNGKPNILVADIWREDITPFNVILAAAKFIKEYCPEGRLHIFGMDKPKHGATIKFIVSLKKAGVLGKWGGIYTKPEELYRAADFVVTPHIIATRIVREAMACGCPVVKNLGLDLDKNVISIKECWERYQKYIDTSKIIRSISESNFNLEKTGQQMKEVCEKVLADKSRQNIPMKYDEYITLQKSKDASWFLEKYDKFYYDLLMDLIPKLPYKQGKTLCLGARDGTEVRAFLDNGIFCWGIDINPKSELVNYGDFNHIDSIDGDYRAVYTNSLDHIFDFDQFITEVKRVLCKDGYFVVLLVNPESIKKDKWATFKWNNSQEIIDLLEKAEFKIVDIIEIPSKFNIGWFDRMIVGKKI